MTSQPPVPFNDLSRFDDDLIAEIESSVSRVIRSGWYILGPENSTLEAALASFLGAGEAITLGNGTDALELSLAALGVGPGDSVLTVANAGGYTSVATRLLGARPVFCDIDPMTLLPTAATVRAALETLPEAPRAIVVTHLYGALAPVQEIVAVADEAGIPVVEDCAQSFGASIEGRRGGTFGRIATTSFYPTKNLGGMGDGGAIFTADEDLAARVRSLRQYGWGAKYTIERPHGRNSRMDEIQAAIVAVQLERLDANNARRRDIHRRYETAGATTVRVVNTADESFTAHLAVVQAEHRADARAVFDRFGVKTDVHYPVADHRQPIQPPDETWSLPSTEHATDTVFSIPMFPELRDDEVDRVCEALGEL
ncbi:hypothetical protein ASE14_05460 [Agromyces sp. Root81]|uniref:DegT/DnrJ/EryC1/StrS family aminotransferase n=1 Tax=Agromyces sp. Root81 TaxID=1736601 RepID=UPI000701DC0E|nr:DegT/DnrJ/EryC1/StrS family aminotransferase [Agromyces sp. Root81]KRC60468.1 hypothetical protein ASE14_05460 [Agromyces sp. Root81]